MDGAQFDENWPDHLRENLPVKPVASEQTLPALTSTITARFNYGFINMNYFLIMQLADILLQTRKLDYLLLFFFKLVYSLRGLKWRETSRILFPFNHNSPPPSPRR